MNTSDSADPIVANALANLEFLTPEVIPNLDDSCPICLLTFRAVIDSREDNIPEKADAGVARVGGCGHLFCAEDLSEWIKGRHGTCPTCRHEFLPELRPVDSDAESSDEEYVPTEIDADTDMDTDYEDGFMDSDGIDLETMDADDTPYLAGDDEATEGEERESIASSRVHAGYHESHDPEAQSVCGSEAAWWDGSVDGEQEWGLTDGDSMGTSEGELSFGDRQLETNVQVRLDSEGEYTIYEDSTEPKT